MLRVALHYRSAVQTNAVRRGARTFSGAPLVLPPALQQSVETAGRITRTPVKLGPISDVVPFVRASFQGALEPGARVLVVCHTTASKRAGALLHFLRKAGYLPLPCELPDAVPTGVHVSNAVATAKRAGCTAVAAFGSAGVLNIGRATAAMLVNTGKIIDYVSRSSDGRGAALSPSAPFLAVPSCPAGTELCRHAHLLADGSTLATLPVHPASMQAAYVDPALANSLEDDAALCTGYALLCHAIEGYLRSDADPSIRALAGQAVHLTAGAIPASVRNPADVQVRLRLACASVLTSAALSTGPLGPARGTALTIAARYSVPYSSAMTAIGPEVLSSIAEFLMNKYEEEEDARAADAASDDAAGEGDGEGEEEGSKEMRWSSNIDSKPGSGSRQWKKGDAFGTSKSSRKKPYSDGSDTYGMTAAEKAEEEAFDAALSSVAHAAADAAAAEAAVAGGGKAAEEADAAASDVALGARRWVAVSRVLRDAAAAISASGNTGAAGAGAGADAPGAAGLASPPPPGPIAQLPKVTPEGIALVNSVGASLQALRACGVTRKEGGPVHPPQLEDYNLTEADLTAVASAAEVDDNTLASVVSLTKNDLLTMLKRC